MKLLKAGSTIFISVYFVYLNFIANVTKILISITSTSFNNIYFSLIMLTLVKHEFRTKLSDVFFI